MEEGSGLTEHERAELDRLPAQNAALRAQGQAAAPGPPALPARRAAAVAHDRRRPADRARLCAGAAGRGGGVGPQPGHQHRPLYRHGGTAGQRPRHPEGHRRPDHRPGLHLHRRPGADHPGRRRRWPAWGPRRPRVAAQLQALAGPDRQRRPELHPHPGRQGRPEPGVRGRLGAGQPGWPTPRWSRPSPARAAGRSRSRTTPSASTWRRSSRRSSSGWSPRGSPWPSGSRQVNASFVLFQSADITRARSAFNLLNTLGNWLPVVALCCWRSGSTWPRTTAGRWSAPPSGWRAACCVLASAWPCSGPSTWTPCRPRCCPMTPPRCCTTPSSGSCAPGCARCWCWPWWWPPGRS